MFTWSDALVEVHGRLPAGSKGVVRGFSQNTDIGPMIKEFTAKIQIKERVYGAGSAEARQAEAALSSRLI
ncbi:hypothetical protein B0H17DRAFT_1208495 [Mycena rosella]|uniref:Uncharacterized protein n=1 Tax=Mycena rosella TaxID=1033263 RepID=A0AAD7GAN8_MYCRO|nr:hypothetical protein B0H17DRAFT_1208495 [Mycena rosella]